MFDRVEIVFARGKTRLAAIQSWLFEEEVTHVGLRFSSDWSNRVFHSSSKGPHWESWGSFREDYEFIDAVPITAVKQKICDLQDRCNRMKTKSYDRPAWLYLGLMGLRKKLFGLELPEKNRLDTGGYICTEVLRPVRKLFPNQFGGSLWPADLSMATPGDILYRTIGAPSCR